MVNKYFILLQKRNEENKKISMDASDISNLSINYEKCCECR